MTTSRTDASSPAVSSTSSTPGTSSGSAAGRRRRGRRVAGIVAAVVAAVVLVTLPLSVADRFWLTIITSAGVLAVGAVGLNLLSGYLGEASLGHAFFMGIGAYVGIYVAESWEAPLLVWVPVVLVAGGLVGAITGPLALRLQGGHLLMVTLALVFLGQWIFVNWRSVTGGPSGRSVDLPLSIGALDFGELSIGGTTYSPAQSFAVLVWLVCVIAIVVVRNIARSRTGRAMRAIHDNPMAASAAGISLVRAKLAGFVVSSALAALAGALYGQQLRYLEPAVFGLLLSLQFFVILVIGGAGTTAGPVIGAFFVGAVPLLLGELQGVPFILGPNEPGFGLSAGQFSNFAFGLLVVLFLLIEPGGLMKIFARLGHWGSRLLTRRTRA